MINDVILNKTQTIKRCLQRINEEYQGDEQNLHNYTKQDSIILNLQRACEASIDLAMHIVAEKNLGIPQSSRQKPLNYWHRTTLLKISLPID